MPTLSHDSFRDLMSNSRSWQDLRTVDEQKWDNKIYLHAKAAKQRGI